MMETSQLSVRAQRYLLSAMDMASHVQGRADLYMWARGPLWAAFPHEIMLCSLQNAQGTVTQVECLHSDVLPTQLIADLCDTQSGLLVRLQRLCRDNGVRQLGLASAVSPAPEPPYHWLADVAAEWAALKLGPLWWVDTGPLPASHSTGVALVGPQLDDSHDAWPLLPLMVGPMHLALVRALCTTGPVFDAHARELNDLTERQLEIMRWVRLGKTNHEIASIMDISPFTVKNHLQKMFKKMNVHNRAQAVARSSGLL